MQTETLMLWPTPVIVHRYVKSAGFNAALVEAVMPRELYPPVEKETGDLGSTWDRFDPKGWDGNLFSELAHVPEMGELRRMFEETVQEYIARHLDRRYLGRNLFMRAWANRYEKGMNVVGHHHGAMHLTATYYPQAGVPATADPLEGCLVLLDPRGGHLLTMAGSGQRFCLRPEHGMMVVLPGYLQHETGPFHGSPARVAISADILIQYKSMRAFNEPLEIKMAGGAACAPTRPLYLD